MDLPRRPHPAHPLLSSTNRPPSTAGFSDRTRWPAPFTTRPFMAREVTGITVRATWSMAIQTTITHGAPARTSRTRPAIARRRRAIRAGRTAPIRSTAARFGQQPSTRRTAHGALPATTHRAGQRTLPIAARPTPRTALQLPAHRVTTTTLGGSRSAFRALHPGSASATTQAGGRVLRTTAHMTAGTRAIDHTATSSPAHRAAAGGASRYGDGRTLDVGPGHVPNPAALCTHSQ